MSVPFRPSFPMPFAGVVARFCAFSAQNVHIHRTAFQRRRTRAMADWLRDFPEFEAAPTEEFEDGRYSTTEEYRIFSEQLAAQDEQHARESLSECETMLLQIVRVPSRITIPARTDPRATVPILPVPRKTKLWHYLDQCVSQPVEPNDHVERRDLITSESEKSA